MDMTPKWYRPVTVVALLWNLLGCAAYLADVTISPEDVLKMSEAQQALYASRPWWAVSATAIAVWGGALGSLGLIIRRRWATPLLVASLVGVVVQDIGLFGLTDAAAASGPAPVAMQGLVLIVSIGLVMLARKATATGWLQGASRTSA